MLGESRLHRIHVRDEQDGLAHTGKRREKVAAIAARMHKTHQVRGIVHKAAEAARGGNRGHHAVVLAARGVLYNVEAQVLKALAHLGGHLVLVKRGRVNLNQLAKNALNLRKLVARSHLVAHLSRLPRLCLRVHSIAPVSFPLPGHAVRAHLIYMGDGTRDCAQAGEVHRTTTVYTRSPGRAAKTQAWTTPRPRLSETKHLWDTSHSQNGRHDRTRIGQTQSTVHWPTSFRQRPRTNRHAANNWPRLATASRFERQMLDLPQ